MQRPHSLFITLAATVAFTACSEQPQVAADPTEHARQLPSSDETRQHTGIAEWVVDRGDARASVVGLGEDGEPVVVLDFMPSEATPGEVTIFESLPNDGTRVLARDGTVLADTLSPEVATAIEALSADCGEAHDAGGEVVPSDAFRGWGETCVGWLTSCYGVVQYCTPVDWNGQTCADSWHCGWCFGWW